MCLIIEDESLRFTISSNYKYSSPWLSKIFRIMESNTETYYTLCTRDSTTDSISAVHIKNITFRCLVRTVYSSNSLDRMDLNTSYINNICAFHFQTFADLKTNVRRKARLLKAAQIETGGGSPKHKPLTEFEKKMLHYNALLYFKRMLRRCC